jgi:hypothetical protein
LRSFNLSTNGIEVGEVLREFHGILTGVPQLAKPARPAAPRNRNA